MNTIIEQVSFWGAVVGSVLLALNIPISGWAYIPFLISNIATIYLLKRSNAPKIVAWQSGFFIFINIVGIVRWLI